MRTFKVITEKDEDGFYTASVPELKGCHTQAKTIEDLRLRVKEVIALCIEENGRDLKLKSNEILIELIEN